MDALTLFARIAVGLVAVTAVGALATFATAVRPDNALVVGLVLLVFTATAVWESARRARRTRTSYWG